MINGEFDDEINIILDKISNLAPTFFLIDPFGFSAIKMSTLKRIMKLPKTEILLNFMFNAINRFLGFNKVEDTLNDLFGGTEWKTLCDKKGKCREELIIKLYRKKLKEFSNFVYYYRMSFPDKKRSYYYLFHLTNNILGCSIMKSSFAKYNNGRMEYNGKFKIPRSLFEYEEIHPEIKKIILNLINKDSKTYSTILNELIDEIPYLESEIKKVIKLLESKGVIRIERKPEFTKTGRKRTSIESQDLIVKF